MLCASEPKTESGTAHFQIEADHIAVQVGVVVVFIHAARVQFQCHFFRHDFIEQPLQQRLEFPKIVYRDGQATDSVIKVRRNICAIDLPDSLRTELEIFLHDRFGVHLIDDWLQVIIAPVLVNTQQDDIKGFAFQIRCNLRVGLRRIADFDAPDASIVDCVQCVYFIPVGSIIQDGIHTAVVGILEIQVLRCDEQSVCLLEIIFK